jgi:hypothetical protein
MSAWRRKGRDLPIWSCEFDSRHPLHVIAPSQGALGVAELFQADDKNGKAGHASSTIMSALSTELPCQGPRF